MKLDVKQCETAIKLAVQMYINIVALQLKLYFRIGVLTLLC